MKKKRIYGEISIEDYQRVLAASQRKKNRIAANGTEREVADPAAKPTLWEQIKSVPRPVLILLMFPIFYSAGATWQWDGRWSRMLTPDQAALVLENSNSTDIDVRNALGELRGLLRKGVNDLASAAGRKASYSEDALAYLENTLEQVQELYAQVRHR